VNQFQRVSYVAGFCRCLDRDKECALGDAVLLSQGFRRYGGTVSVIYVIFIGVEGLMFLFGLFGLEEVFFVPVKELLFCILLHFR